MTVPMKAAQTRGEVMEAVLIKGDLSRLTPEERSTYYMKVCESIGFNPLTRPLEYITLNGKLTLYAKRDAADQLRKLNGISVEIVSQDAADGLLTVHVRAKDNSGRTDEDLGVVSFPETLKGEARANAILKAVTKAKRRVTLSISGLGFLDETEVEDIPASSKRPVAAPNVMLPAHDEVTGEIVELPSRAGAPSEANAAPSHPSRQSTDGAAPIPTAEEYASMWKSICSDATDAAELHKIWTAGKKLRDRITWDGDEFAVLKDKVTSRIAELKTPPQS